MPDHGVNLSQDLVAMTSRLEMLLSLSAALSTQHRAVLAEAEELIAAIDGKSQALIDTPIEIADAMRHPPEHGVPLTLK